MPNIPIDTPMSPGLYGIVQKYSYPVVDLYWNLSIAALLAPIYEPNMYELMTSLYRGGSALPLQNDRPNRASLSGYFSQFWLGTPLPGQQATHETEVRRGSVEAMGGVFYDIVRTGLDGNSGTNGTVPYQTARVEWEQHNQSFLAQELMNLKTWLQARSN